MEIKSSAMTAAWVCSLSFLVVQKEVQQIRHKGKQMTKNRLRFWIIITLIVLAVLLTGVDATFALFQRTTIETHTYTIGTWPTLLIHDDTGSITIQAGRTNSQITI